MKNEQESESGGSKAWDRLGQKYDVGKGRSKKPGSETVQCSAIKELSTRWCEEMGERQEIELESLERTNG